jgi:nucleoside-diphosphate-sugar epimerase
LRVLITGGAGFIGSHIAERMVQDGHEVRIVDNLSSGRRDNIRHFEGAVSFVEGDIRDAQLLHELSEGCDLVYHQAAVVSVPYSIEHPQESHDVNIQGTLNVLQAARARQVKRVVFASSAAIYGDDPELPKREEFCPAPISPYGVEKITAEHYCSVFGMLYGVETVCLRYFNVFGPRQDPSSPYSGVISIFVDRLSSGRQPTVFGDGEQYRDFVFVGNVVQANCLAGTVPKAAGRVYNVGCGAKTSLNRLLTVLGQVLDTKAAAEYAPPRSGDIRESVASVERARIELGYAPEVGLEEGLQRLVAYAK